MRSLRSPGEQTQPAKNHENAAPARAPAMISKVGHSRGLRPLPPTPRKSCSPHVPGAPLRNRQLEPPTNSLCDFFKATPRESGPNLSISRSETWILVPSESHLGFENVEMDSKMLPGERRRSHREPRSKSSDYSRELLENLRSPVELLVQLALRSPQPPEPLSESPKPLFPAPVSQRLPARRTRGSADLGGAGAGAGAGCSWVGRA